MKRLIVTFLVAAVILVSAGTVNATISTIEAVYVAVDAGGQEGVNLPSYNGANGVMIFNTQNATGPLAQQVPSHTWMYCTDLSGYMDFAYALYNVDTPEAVFGTDKANLIRQLWTLHYDHSWETDTAIYYGGSFGGFISGQPANTTENQIALAFSYALYEIVYDYDGTLPSLNLSAGSFQAGTSNPAASVGIAADWLSGLSNLSGVPLANLVALIDTTINPTYQTLITEVPEPATVCLLGLGALSLIKKKK